MSTTRHVIRARPLGAPRCRLVALAATAALAAPAAWADSGLIGDTTLGNSIVPAAGALRARDAEGLGGDAKRTPTGFLQQAPFALGERPSGAGWWTSGSVEIGGLALDGDRAAAKFGEYRSLKNGAYLAGFALHAEQPAEGLFVEASAGGLGYHDQYADVSVGRHNAWKLSGFYNEINHVYTSTYRNLWNGTGSNRLTLAGLPAAPVAPATALSTNAAMGAAALATPYSTLAALREKGGLRFEVHLGDASEIFVSLANEKRKGARPFGMVSGGGGGTGGVEIPESIDYDTTDVVAGLRWSGARTSANVQASASLFRNHAGTLTVDNPMFVAAANGIARFPQAVFDLYPDNDMYNLKAELAHSMPELARLRLTGVVSLTSMRQNDALIPATPYAGAAVNGIAGGAWDTPASLSRTSAQAKIDTRLFDFGVALGPAPGLDLRAKLRRYETSNGTPEYLTCNPLTGQWARLTNDGSGTVALVPNAGAGNNPAGTPATAYNTALCSIDAGKALRLVPSAGNVNVASVPYEQTQDNVGGSAEWRFARSQLVSAALERETTRRAHRERDRTWDDRLKLGYVNRALAGGTLRASLEGSRRRGSTYNPDPYEEFFSASFGPEPRAAGTNMTSWIHINALHRKFDLADRDQTTLNLRFNTALADELDLALAAQLREQKYPDSAYGRGGRQTQNSVNVDLNWQPVPTTNLFGFAAQQDARMTQTGIQQNACVLGSTYYLYSDGSVAATNVPTPAQVAAGVTVVGTAGPVTAANFQALCVTAGPLSPLYPTSRAWSATQTDRSTSIGLGARHDFGPLRLDASYTWTDGRSKLDYAYNAAAMGLVTSGAPSATQLASLALIGSGLPAMKLRQEVLDANLLVPLNPKLTLRFLLRYEKGRISDWHYDGLAATPAPSTNQQLYLDAGPQDYRVTMFGAFMQIAW